MFWFNNSTLENIYCSHCKGIIPEPEQCAGCYDFLHEEGHCKPCVVGRSECCVSCGEVILESDPNSKNTSGKDVGIDPNSKGHNVKSVDTNPNTKDTNMDHNTKDTNMDHNTKYSNTKDKDMDHNTKDSNTKESNTKDPNIKDNNTNPNSNSKPDPDSKDTNTTLTLANINFHLDSFCATCIKRVKSDEFCPVCIKCYDAEDYDTPMIQCNFCLRWVHLSCDPKRSAQYNAMEDVDYCCKPCKRNMNKWNSRVREDMENGIGMRRFSIRVGEDDTNASELDWGEDSSDPNTKQNDPDPNTEIIKDDAPRCAHCHGFPSTIKPALLTQNQNVYSHIHCQNLDPNLRCNVCTKKQCTVKCPQCKTDVYHLKCAEGIFRVHPYYPMCADHYLVSDPRTDTKKSKNKKSRTKESDPTNKGDPITTEKYALNRNTIYTPTSFIGLFLKDSKLHIIKFNGIFFLDGVVCDPSYIKNSIQVDVLNFDVFRINSQEYREYRNRVGNECVLKEYLTLYNGVLDFYFGD